MFEVDNQFNLLAYWISFNALKELFGTRKKRSERD